ncbi:MAG: sigma-54 dependent transcriptional regulator [Planctomycetota bacterium]|nr:sigma-54 dependent transcriptional regulator [Planctomycetota bacterium]
MVTSTRERPETAESEAISILIVDNDQPHASAVAESLERVGYDCTVATSGPEAAELVQQNKYDLVFTDLVMPEIDGMEVLRRCKHALPDAEVIVVTGHGTVSSAVEAMQQGAFTYIEKGAGIEHLRTITSRAAEAQALRRTNAELHRRLDEKFGFEGVIGNSRQMNEVIEKLKRIAPTDASVLIQGATGTGKELVAQAIHQNSPRKNKPFVALNCAALSEHILESELFGHVKGAFTDASADRVGKFEYAHGGTLFLDEVGDMPMPTQIKLLRVLESGEITRVGSNEPICVNVRILSATNRDLQEFIQAGIFRSDLYHRLKVVTVVLPQLTERAQDIPLLTDYFTKQFAARHKKKIKSMATAARRRLIGYDWPGNVRQLRNVIESMVVVDHDGVLGLDDLPDELAEQFSETKDGSSDVPGTSFSGLLGKPLVDVEKHFISETLNLVGGNREEAAKILAIGERTLYRKIKEFQL